MDAIMIARMAGGTATAVLAAVRQRRRPNGSRAAGQPTTLTVPQRAPQGLRQCGAAIPAIPDISTETAMEWVVSDIQQRDQPRAATPIGWFGAAA